MGLGNHDLSNILSGLVTLVQDNLLIVPRSELSDLLATIPGFEDANKREGAVRDLFLCGILIEPKRADGFIFNHPVHPLTRDEIFALQAGKFVASKWPKPALSERTREKWQRKVGKKARNVSMPSFADDEGNAAEPHITQLPLSPETVMRVVTAVFNTTPEAILEQNRKKDIAGARHVAMYLVRHVCGESYPRAMVLFKRDHTSVFHGCKKIATELKTDAILRKTVNAILDELKKLAEAGEDVKEEK